MSYGEFHPIFKIVRVIGESYLGLIRVYIEYVHKDLRLRNGKPQKKLLSVFMQNHVQAPYGWVDNIIFLPVVLLRYTFHQWTRHPEDDPFSSLAISKNKHMLI